MIANKLPPIEVGGYTVDVLVCYLDNNSVASIAPGYYDTTHREWLIDQDNEVIALEPDVVIGWWPMPTTDDPTFVRLGEVAQ